MKTIDMTEGKIATKLTKFAIPLIAGNILQQMYVFFDTLFVGRYIGTNGLAALGTVEWIVFIIISGAQGFTQGFSIDIAQSAGKKDRKTLEEAIEGSINVCVLLSITITAVGLILGKGLLRLLNTPDEIIGLSWSYLRILILGIAITTFYNMFSGILRSYGNSVTPLNALILSSIVNIILDFLFIYYFKLGVVGAAVATLLAQLSSLIYCTKYVVKIFGDDKLHFSFNVNPRKMYELIKLGVPLCFQNIVIGIGGVAVQAVINTYGAVFIAGYTAANKLYGLLEIGAWGLNGAVGTFVGQNKGANNYRRVNKGFRISVVMAIVMGAFMSGIMLGLGEPILRLFLEQEGTVNMSTITIGKEFLNFLAAFFPLLYILYVLYAVVQGMGNTFMSMISSFAQLFMRIACAYLLTSKIGYYGFFVGEVMAWVGSNLMLYLAYRIKMKKWRLECYAE
ncbi:MATE family efflux transporter [Butyrivibrio sp. AD3002]|uniref:MATE family efflux transporter n=1 Tax=Butyrivibrio sp. AD3002 TaxID=1280670 RepID=UPI0003B4BD82|nr:MATE family efflux transporter [Butyrivibrio sp. AD3002]